MTAIMSFSFSEPTVPPKKSLLTEVLIRDKYNYIVCVSYIRTNL
jgi:hypothetical protein